MTATFLSVLAVSNSGLPTQRHSKTERRLKCLLRGAARLARKLPFVGNRKNPWGPWRFMSRNHTYLHRWKMCACLPSSK